MPLRFVAVELGRTLRDPARLRRLHYSTVLATAHRLIEPDEATLLARLFGVGRDAHDRLAHDLTADRGFAESIDRRHRAIRGTGLRLFGATAAEDADPRCRLLYYCVRLQRPAVVVETGVFDGVSTSVILKALADNGAGRLESIDLPPRAPVRASTDRMATTALPPGETSGWLVPEALRKRWTLRLGAAEDVLGTRGGVDLFFHDSLHTDAHMTFELEWAWAALAPGGLVICDDVFWSRAFRRFCRTHRVRGIVARGMGIVRTA